MQNQSAFITNPAKSQGEDTNLRKWRTLAKILILPTLNIHVFF